MVDQNSQFYAILTNVGAAKQANADALGIPWKITQMGVGDANGADPTPNATQTSLINEWRRAPLNQLKVDDKNSAIIVAEQVIPADVGGKWIREIALYDADGDMVAVANCAPTYKPLLSQGSGRTQVVRMNLIVSSASNVQLKIDPAVVLATREWVTEELARQDFKHSMLVATTAAITLSGLQTVDGVALPAGARVLVKNQAAAKDNGLYTVVAGGPWTRCTDADSSDKVTPGLLVLVERGAVNADSGWQLVSDGPITLGVTALGFEMAFGRTGVAAGTYQSVKVDTYGRVLSASNPTTVAGYGLTDVYTRNEVDQVMLLKAPVANPVFEGVPKVPTAAVGDNSMQAASTAYVIRAINALVNAAPGTLDTLKELADALGNDPSFATTVANSLALKAPLASPAFSGIPLVPTATTGNKSKQAINSEFLRATLDKYGLGATQTGDVSSAAQLPTLPSGHYYYDSSFSPYGGYAFVQRTTYNGSAGFEVANIPYADRIFARASNADGTWRIPFELAKLNSPSFVGVPVAPTAASGTNSQQLATTAFVQTAVGNRLIVSGVSQQRPQLASAVNTADWRSTGLELREVQQVGEWAPAEVRDEYGPGLAFHWAGKYAAKLHMDVGGQLKWNGYPLASLVNPVFTGAPKADTAPYGDDTTRLANTSFVQSALRNAVSLTLGVGQTWQDVRTSRAANTTYTNTTGRPIVVTLSQVNHLGLLLKYFVNGLEVCWSSSGVQTGISDSVSFIVPHGVTYSCNFQPTTWLELR